MEWMLLPLKRYADFSGRSRRKEYWMFALLVFILTFVIAFPMSLSALNQSATSSLNISLLIPLLILLVISLAIIIPSLAVQVRRFHDLDKSGWFILLNFIPYIGPIIVLVFMCMDGTRGPNRFGDDPKAGEPGR